jgi:hypothetical protein
MGNTDHRQTKARKVFVKSEANDTFKNGLDNHIRDRVTKRKLFVFNEETEYLFRFFADRFVIVNNGNNRFDLVKELESCL